jgi:hypothetical protein
MNQADFYACVAFLATRNKTIPESLQSAFFNITHPYHDFTARLFDALNLFLSNPDFYNMGVLHGLRSGFCFMSDSSEKAEFFHDEISKLIHDCSLSQEQTTTPTPPQKPSDDYLLKVVRCSDNFPLYILGFPKYSQADDVFDTVTKSACDMSITGNYCIQLFKDHTLRRELWLDDLADNLEFLDQLKADVSLSHYQPICINCGFDSFDTLTDNCPECNSVFVQVGKVQS